VKALILAGGFATRLRPLSCGRPKTLFPVVNKPLLQWNFERLSQNGVDEAIMAVNALTQFYIRQQHLPKCGLKVRYSIDPPKTPLGTGGPIKKAQRLLGRDEPFLVLNGDIFIDIDYRGMVEAHKKCGALATIALCEVKDPCAFGVAELEGGSCIKNFVEKPAPGEAPSNLINAGVYVLSPKVFDYIPSGKHVSMEREIFPKLVAEKKMFGYPISGLWMDIGKPQEYLEANKTVLDTLGKSVKQPAARGFKLNAPTAVDSNVFIAEKSVIGPYAIIGKNAKIGKNVKIKDSVIFPHAKIDDGAVLNGVIVGEGAKIGRNVHLGKGCIVGDQAKIKDGSRMPEGLAICPAKEVSENNLRLKMDC
jgi:mannose-1-phosphate guanylyltransferase